MSYGGGLVEDGVRIMERGGRMSRCLGGRSKG